jgi:hypothetical protein
MDLLTYKPPKTIKEFIRTYTPGGLFYNWIVGPFGSGKTTANFFKLGYMSKLQTPDRNGVKKSRCVVVRNTAQQLTDTTIKSWNYWFKDGEAGEWQATNRTFVLRFNDGSCEVECEVLFRPLDTEDDVNRVLSLELTFAIVDEFVQLPRAVIEGLSGRCGRYPPEKDGGAANWGMWGSSNPDTENCWWYDYFYKSSQIRHYSLQSWESEADRKTRFVVSGLEEPEGIPVISYFHQPGGLHPLAENLDHLPPYRKGDHSYYLNLKAGKSKAWTKQFIDAEWGFSVDGKPVISSFEPERHIATSGLKFNPLLPLVVGLDPGVECSAMIFTQMDLWGRLLVFGELIQEGYGATRLIETRLKPYLRLRFPNARVVIAPDPAANNRTQTDERTVVEVFRRVYEVKVETNNRLPLRLDAIDHFMEKSVEAGPAFLIDPKHCPLLVRALKGGWKWELKPKDDGSLKEHPMKNLYSHPGDGLGYAARFHYRETAREMRYNNGGRNGSVWTPKRNFGARSYHMT